MVDKLEQLVLRLEKAVQALEVGGNSQGNNQNQQQQQQAQSGATSSKLPSLIEFDTLLKEFQNNANSLNKPEITEITNIVVVTSQLMKQVMYYSENAKKLDPASTKNAMGIFKEHLQKLQPFLKKRDFDLHSKTMSDASSTFFWVFVEAPEMSMQGTIESAEFNGLKLRKAYPDHANWMVSLFNALKALQAYAKANFPIGLIWNPKGTKTPADLENDLRAIISGQQPQQTAEQPKQQTQQLQPQIAQVKPEPKKEEVKEPRKYQQQDKYYADNFTGGQVVFPENEINLRTTIFIEKSKNTTFNVPAKVKSIQFSNCQKCYLTCKGVVASVECMNSKSVELFLLETSPTVVIDKCDNIHLVLPKQQPEGTEIITSMSQTVNVTYLLNDDFDQEKDTFIPQQLKTVWDSEKKKFVTSTYDMFL